MLMEQTVDKSYGKASEGHHDPLTGFVSAGHAGWAGWFRPKAKPFLSFFTAVSFADGEKCKLGKVAKPLCRPTEATGVAGGFDYCLFIMRQSR